MLSRISLEISLSLGASGSACTDLMYSFSFFLSMSGSIRPMNLSPYSIGENVVPVLAFTLGSVDLDSLVKIEQELRSGP